jgi:hypothetical protein
MILVELTQYKWWKPLDKKTLQSQIMLCDELEQ